LIRWYEGHLGMDGMRNWVFSAPSELLRVYSDLFCVCDAFGSAEGESSLGITVMGIHLTLPPSDLLMYKALETLLALV